MKRIVQPELLDSLPPEDPRAIRSRRDLRRVNGWMRHHSIMAAMLRNALKRQAIGRIVELGAGDGNFLLRVARAITPAWTNVTATLLDLQNCVTPETLGGFAVIGWRARVVVADVFDWRTPVDVDEIVIANLFLHHFENEALVKLFGLISQRANSFIALEPRRAAWPLFCSRLLWAIGCSRVTRNDAIISVGGGFSGTELSCLWPDKLHWQLTERRTGAFSHLFMARRIC